MLIRETVYVIMIAELSKKWIINTTHIFGRTYSDTKHCVLC